VADETAAPSPESDPTTVPSSTPAVGPDADAPSANPTPSDMASCVAAEAEFPVEPNLPPVTADDHVRGSDDASITLIEYSDFQ
jgi:hypothetical protein